MTYLVITDNLIDNLDDLEINELKYEKIKSEEISNSTNVSLFSDNSYKFVTCLLYTSPSPRDLSTSRMPSSA